MLPNLIVIGAAKCGTTSLHEYLDLHPSIAMSQEKELNFFVAEKNWERGVDWYRQQFDPGFGVRGESSPAYSVFPLYDGVPERMARTIPDAKVIYLVRDPIERIVSHYVHRTVNWPEMGRFDEAMRSPDLREWLVTPSRYGTQLDRYLDEFPAEHVLVLDTDELQHARDEALARVFRFLGIDASFRTARHSERHNVAIGSRPLTPAGRRVSTLLERTLGHHVAQVVRERAPTRIKARFRRPVDPPELPDALRATLEEELQPEVDRLRARTGLAFASWSL